MKLKNVQAYPVNQVPDHLTHECQELAQKFIEAIEPLIDFEKPNIAFGAITFLHAALIHNLISESPGELEKSTKMAAVGLVRNVENLSGRKIFEPEDL